MISVLTNEHCTKNGSVRLFVRANNDGLEVEYSLHVVGLSKEASRQAGFGACRSYHCLYRGNSGSVADLQFDEWCNFFDNLGR